MAHWLKEALIAELMRGKGRRRGVAEVKTALEGTREWPKLSADRLAESSGYPEVVPASASFGGLLLSPRVSPAAAAQLLPLAFGGKGWWAASIHQANLPASLTVLQTLAAYTPSPRGGDGLPRLQGQNAWPRAAQLGTGVVRDSR